MYYLTLKKNFCDSGIRYLFPRPTQLFENGNSESIDAGLLDHNVIIFVWNGVIVEIGYKDMKYIETPTF